MMHKTFIKTHWMTSSVFFKFMNLTTKRIQWIEGKKVDEPDTIIVP